MSDENRPFPFPIKVDDSLPPGVIRIEDQGQACLVKLYADESAEFIGGPLDGTIVRTT